MLFKNGIWIIGAGGIGSALAKKCQAANITVKLIARPEYDMTQPREIEGLIDAADPLPSAIINTIGMLHNDQYGPEKSAVTFNDNWFFESLRVNALPTMHIAKSLTPKLKKHDELIFLILSARVSSISDNHLGGWYSYRASKCALNMLIKNISIEWARRFPKVAICGYHPGTVATHLSKPFQHNVTPENLFSPQQAAGYLLAQIERTLPSMSGNLYDWQGKIITP